MDIADYRKKFFLKLYKKQVDLLDSIKSTGNLMGYKRYFDKVLTILEPDLSNALRALEYDKKVQIDYQLTDSIYVMWWQGIQNAPLLVQDNIRRIQKLFGKKNVFIITKDNWQHYCSISNVIIQKFNEEKISITALSDIIRFNLLSKYGGLWIDSTVILSEKCKELLLKYKDKDFFTIFNQDNDYHYISKSQWTVWFIGGKPSYPLFNFITNFYDLYFENHDFLIDYYTIDDIIAYYYQINENFKMDVDSLSNDWHPYLWSNNMNKPYDKSLIEKFKNDPLYGVQKFTYKYEKSVAQDTDSLLYFVLNSKEY